MTLASYLRLRRLDDLIEVLREPVADLVAAAELRHTFADMRRHALTAITEGDEPHHLPGDVQLFAAREREVRAQVAMVEAIAFEVGVDVYGRDRLHLVSAHDDAALAPLFGRLPDLRNHHAEVGGEVDRQPAVRVDRLPIPRS